MEFIFKKHKQFQVVFLSICAKCLFIIKINFYFAVQDENMSISSRLYALQNWKSDSNSLKKFEDLQISIENVAWDEKTSNVTWNLMNDRISNQTNFLLDGQLLPKSKHLVILSCTDICLSLCKNILYIHPSKDR